MFNSIWLDDEIKCLYKETVMDEELSMLLNKPLITIQNKRMDILGESLWRVVNASR